MKGPSSPPELEESGLLLHLRGGKEKGLPEMGRSNALNLPGLGLWPHVSMTSVILSQGSRATAASSLPTLLHTGQALAQGPVHLGN